MTVDVAPVEVTAPAGGGAITGGTLNDILHSGAAHDVLTGGAGADTFDFSAGKFGKDDVLDFTTGTDFLQFNKAAFATPADVLAHAAQAGNNVAVTLDNNDVVTLHNVALANLHTADIHIVG